MGSIKTRRIKVQLVSALKKNRCIPQWKRACPGFKQQYNFTKRSWKRKTLKAC
ncbi:60S ribosomal protein L39 [Spraguea lophii 42_110]|uniref:60S ribosomal protein L39 n=1 Tax=Spraguea lophii (strain 42_110) TaxID=1358809 RepID=S7XTP1_SPRLO|nr:Chain LLL, 60S ribosomal protein L39 [Spraguea lophii 42_110]7QJH_KLL Chain KLL, 60S ribosomal protein L39 [Spraguea lophii 42_110]7QJH_LLL Chain LLL, 60S ribosomal protein L39 [Spraguea lophii 42_110]8BR3_LLL Chain LLL, 60S ribosomal protein L39 [Spraguea lophii 42_110]8P5D_LLL Chain LLL, 60S ribosomal protein L39 [Spraguea lophii 42_110]8P60_KLL Chain KLL, 60S ribosomal protein L39 [Spraguea lophii 42_110]8P60_LLL Chain LLL, 60S ribosomal protein L39 [Spraguea lophii 42_110]EPR79223.1 6